MRQKTGNYPGVTTSIHRAKFSLSPDTYAQLLDLPGAYSLYPNTSDELQLVKLLLDQQASLSMYVYVADVTALDKQLLLLTQLIDLNLPCVLFLTKTEGLSQEQLHNVKSVLQDEFSIPVLPIVRDASDNISTIKQFLSTHVGRTNDAHKTYYQPTAEQHEWLTKIDYQEFTSYTYSDLIAATYTELLPIKERRFSKGNQSKNVKWQIDETMIRYQKMQPVERAIKKILDTNSSSFSNRLDAVFTHPKLGSLVFFGILFFIFQAIYAWSEWPMEMIDRGVAGVGEWIGQLIGPGQLASFIVDGVLAGIGGVIIFIPQIAILFFLLSLFEESGYMARAVYLFDHLMKRFGLSGRSIVSLMSAGACAIPAVMSARTIENDRERLITILVSPFISCSARIPVYTILIGLAVPAVTVFGIFNLKGLAFTGLYVLSALVALLAGFVLKKCFKSDQSSALLIELPPYSMPSMKNVLVIVWSKVRAFVWEAGRIILLISMVLWFLGSYGPGEAMDRAEQSAKQEVIENKLEPAEADALLSSKKLEASYAGHLGKWMEPIIRPLGYDWKIGIGLLASFAAREVFVGTMSTIYSMGDADEVSLKARLNNEVDPKTGKHVFDFATSMSLLIFFLLAMQCMSTLAIVKRETKSWKWPIVQLVGMTTLAYLAAFVVYQVLS